MGPSPSEDKYFYPINYGTCLVTLLSHPGAWPSVGWGGLRSDTGEHDTPSCQEDMTPQHWTAHGSKPHCSSYHLITGRGEVHPGVSQTDITHVTSWGHIHVYHPQPAL